MPTHEDQLKPKLFLQVMATPVAALAVNTSVVILVIYLPNEATVAIKFLNSDVEFIANIYTIIFIYDDRGS